MQTKFCQGFQHQIEQACPKELVVFTHKLTAEKDATNTLLKCSGTKSRDKNLYTVNG
jgi:Tat protein secretion system quality control protein TatD with DNase activity